MVIVYLSSSGVHLPRSFAVLIHVLLIWLLLSIKFSVSSSTSLRNSLMSSSHLFLGLPIALLVLYFELSSTFHSAACINHLSLGDVAILSANLHFIFCESCDPASNLRIFHLFHGIVCALFMYSIQSSSSISAASISSSFSQITRRCRGRCECLSFAHLHFRHQCYSSRSCLFLRWSRLFVSRSFCIYFSFV